MKMSYWMKKNLCWMVVIWWSMVCGSQAQTAWCPVDTNGLWGYADSSGPLRIDCRYGFAQPFERGLSIARGRGGFGVINLEGDTVVPFEYEHVYSSACGYYVGKDSSGYAILNTKTKQRQAVPYEFLLAFDKGGLAAFSQNNRWGYVDTNGMVVIPATYELFRSFKGAPLTMVGDRGKVGVINRAGHLVMPLFCDGAGICQEERIAVQRNDNWGYLSLNGQLVIPMIYHNARAFNENRAAVAYRRGWGYIDRAGKLVIPMVYKHVSDFKQGVAAVETDSGWQLIDTSGVVLTHRWYQKMGDLSEGRLAVKVAGKWGYIDGQD